MAAEYIISKLFFFIVIFHQVYVNDATGEEMPVSIQNLYALCIRKIRSAQVKEVDLNKHLHG